MVLEKAYEAGKATEEAMLDGAMALGKTCMWMRTGGSALALFRKAKEGYDRLLGADHVKYVEASYNLLYQTARGEERTAELSALWERVKISLPDQAVTYHLANDPGIKLDLKGQVEEANLVYRAALEGRRRVLAEKHRDTLMTPNNLGIVLRRTEDYEGALDYYQQAFRAYEKVLGKTHPDTLRTVMNKATVYMVDLEDFPKAEGILRRALDGYEKSLGKDHDDAKIIARNLAILLCWKLKSRTR